MNVMNLATAQTVKLLQIRSYRHMMENTSTLRLKSYWGRVVSNEHTTWNTIHILKYLWVLTSEAAGGEHFKFHAKHLLAPGKSVW
jgi:hypothetical protein